MKKRSRILIAVLLAAGVFAAWWLSSSSTRHEPRYQGRPLGFWVQQYVPTTTNLPYAVKLSDEAANAVREIGTNALPTLLGWMRSPEESLRFKVAQWLAKKRGSGVTDGFLVPKSYQPGNAILAFQTLGPSARDAVPALVQMLHEPPNARPAVRALCAIGTEGAAALGQTLPVVVDGNLRANMLLELIYGISPLMQSNLVPVLAQRLQEDSSYAVSMSAAQVLGTFTNSSAVAVSALAGALLHRDGGTRLTAAESLSYFGEKAVSAIPALEIALKDPNPQVRSNASNALFQIRSTIMPGNVLP